MLYLVDSSGAIAAQYQYDEWGKITAVLNGSGTDVSADASHIANLNPLRYRGYYYDAETGLYYLQSRYYNPEWCRFISADELLDMNEHVFAANLYLYCRNNPIMQKDEQGTKANLCNLYAKKGNGTSPQNWLANTYLNNSLQRYQNQQILQLMLKALDEYRNKQTAAKTLQGKIDRFVEIAMGEVGYYEDATRQGKASSSRNWPSATKFDKFFDPKATKAGEWCAKFVSWCANQAGIQNLVGKSASSKTLSENYIKDNRYIDVTNEKYFPHKGDLVFFYMSGKKRIGHVGMVVYYDKNKNIVYTIEGNRTVDKIRRVVVDQYITYNKYERVSVPMVIVGFGDNHGNSFGSMPTQKDGKKITRYPNYK